MTKLFPEMETHLLSYMEAQSVDSSSLQEEMMPKKTSATRRCFSLFLALVGIAAVSMANQQSLYDKARHLCATSLAREPGTYAGFWEHANLPSVNYFLQSIRAAIEPTVNNSYNVGYVLTVRSCPENLLDHQDDPGHAFYDAAAVLKYTVCDALREPGDPYSECSMYAIVHPDAAFCMGPDGTQYDRVKVLETLGYFVRLWGGQISSKDLTDPYLSETLGSDEGLHELTALNAFRLTRHSMVALIDFSTLILKRPRALFDTFLNDPLKEAAYTREYATVSPPTGSNSGINDGFFLLKPSDATFSALVTEFLSTSYSPTKGWNDSGVTDFAGSTGAKGILTYHYGDALNGQKIDPCLYGNMNENPIDPSTQTCRDGNSSCEDCRNKDFAEIFVLTPSKICGEPWNCWYNENWDPATKAICEDYHRTWFERRESFERNHIVGQPPRDGQYKREIFLGYCSQKGWQGYTPILPDNGVCFGDTHGSTNSLKVPGFPQVQTLELSTNKFTGNGKTCIHGHITTPATEPPFNIGIVIDVSGSTAGAFGGTPVGNLNNDDKTNSILDAEIAAVIRLVETLIQTPGLSNANVDIGLISFAQTATYHGRFAPADPNNPVLINPALLKTLTSLQYTSITNFDDALDKSIQYFQEAPYDRTNILYFLSDGIPNTCGDNDAEGCADLHVGNNHAKALAYTWELQQLDSMNVVRYAIGVGSGSDIREGFGLDLIDNTPNPTTNTKAVQVTSTDSLLGALLDNPVAGTIIGVQAKANSGAFQTMDISSGSIVSGPMGFELGEYVLDGLNQAFGAQNIVSLKVTMDLDGNPATTGDQYTLAAENVVTGTITNLM